MDDPAGQLVRLFERRKVMDMEALQKASGGRSRRSLFRDLSRFGYLSSYTHVGRYYTLNHIPQFDEHGLWIYHGIGFSSSNTLRAALVKLIDDSRGGYTHPELEGLVRTRVHNTLLTLVRSEKIARQILGKKYLYVSREPERASEQIARRQEEGQQEAERLPCVEIIIAVLVEALRAAPVLSSPGKIEARLQAQSVPVTTEQIEQVLRYYGLEAEKKTAG
jgi:hypothetical protein